VNGNIRRKVQGLDLKALYDQVDVWVARPAALATSTFVAYLVGSMLEVHAPTISRRLRGMRYRLRNRLGRQHNKRQTSAVAELTKHAEVTLNAYITDRTNRSYEATAEHLPELLKDLPQLPTRLSAANKDLYGDYDRLAAEADFKANVGLPATVLAIVLVPPWGCLLGVPMGFLIYRGLRLARQANDVLVQAIVTDIVQSPKIEAYITRCVERPTGIHRRAARRWNARHRERSRMPGTGKASEEATSAGD
jgi:hypothetical protein